jgi:putative transport protein
VSDKSVVGKTIRDLDVQNRLAATITRLRRGDIDVVPTPDTRLELGDRVRVLTRRDNFAAVSQFFGDSIRGTAEADFGSVALGMVLGVMVGMMPIPLPGGTTVRLGFAGGPLVVALVLGKLEHTGRINWTLPVSANLTLRNIGLLLFLAGVGTRAGYGFAETMRTTGPQLILAGAAITLAVTVTTMVIGYKALKIPFDVLMGIEAGLQTQPACLAFASNLAKTDAPNLGYASVFPAAMIAKIVLAQLLVLWLGSGA